MELNPWLRWYQYSTFPFYCYCYCYWTLFYWYSTFSVDLTRQLTVGHWFSYTVFHSISTRCLFKITAKRRGILLEGKCLHVIEAGEGGRGHLVFLPKKHNSLWAKNIKLILNSPSFIRAVVVIKCTLVSLNTVHMIIKYWFAHHHPRDHPCQWYGDLLIPLLSLLFRKVRGGGGGGGGGTYSWGRLSDIRELKQQRCRRQREQQNSNRFD